MTGNPGQEPTTPDQPHGFEADLPGGACLRCGRNAAAKVHLSAAWTPVQPVTGPQQVIARILYLGGFSEAATRMLPDDIVRALHAAGFDLPRKAAPALSSATETPVQPEVGSRDDPTSETPTETRTDDRSIAGHCPSCGWESLTRANGGHVTCGRLECPRPTAADEILADSETEHVVHLFAGTFTIRHPLRERLDDQLMTCDLHDHIAGLAGPPAAPGRYRAVGEGDNWTWQPIAEETTRVR